MSKNKSFSRVSLIALAAVTMLTVRPSFAHATATTAQLQAEINELQAQINALSNQQSAVTAQVSDNAIAVKKLGSSKPKVGNWGAVSKGNVLPDFVSDDGKSSFKIIGRLQGDLTMRQVPGASPKNGPAASLNGKGTSLNESFRRVRLGIEGQYDKYWIYKLQYDFLGTAPADGITDAYFGYHRKYGKVGNEFLVGNQFVAFGQHTPSNYSTFMENSLDTSAFRPGRQLGVSGREFSKYWNVWYSLTDGRNAAGSGSGTLALSGQIGVNLINTGNVVVHLGNSFLYNRFGGGASPGTSFKTVPEAHFYGADLISTPPLSDVRSNFVYSPSLVVKYGPASFRANYYMENSMDHSNTGMALAVEQAQAKFSGWAVQGDYILTGETRPFSDKNGAFVGIKPLHPVTDGGWGAFQVAARVDSANLNDVHHGVRGGRETNVTIALNWFPTSYTRVDLDYIKVLKIVGGAYDGYDPSIVAARMQFVF